jgi:hypothetical protein
VVQRLVTLFPYRITNFHEGLKYLGFILKLIVMVKKIGDG